MRPLIAQAIYSESGLAYLSNGQSSIVVAPGRVVVHPFKLTKGEVFEFGILKRSDVMMISDADHKIQIWDVNKGRLIHSIQNCHAHRVRGGLIDDNGNQILTIGSDLEPNRSEDSEVAPGYLKQWSLKNGAKRHISTFGDTPVSIAKSRSLERIVVGTKAGWVHFYTQEKDSWLTDVTRRLVAKDGTPSSLSKVAVSLDGEMVATNGASATMVWKTKPKIRQILQLSHTGQDIDSVFDICFLCDGRFVMAQNGLLTAYDFLKSNQPQCRIEFKSSAAFMSPHPTKNQILVGVYDANTEHFGYVFQIADFDTGLISTTGFLEFVK